MKSDIRERILDIARSSHGYIRTKDVLVAGIHNVYLQQLVDEGVLEKVKRGLYRWTEASVGNHDSLVQAAIAIPNGVVCLLSALAYYNMTTVTPWEVSIAIRQDQKATLPDYPPVKLYYFSSKLFSVGITKITVQGIPVQIYSKEKTICDCVRYREAIGIDVVREAMQAYIKSSARDLENLMEIAKASKVDKVIRSYLEVLL